MLSEQKMLCMKYLKPTILINKTVGFELRRI